MEVTTGAAIGVTPSVDVIVVDVPAGTMSPIGGPSGQSPSPAKGLQYQAVQYCHGSTMILVVGERKEMVGNKAVFWIPKMSGLLLGRSRCWMVTCVCEAVALF